MITLYIDPGTGLIVGNLLAIILASFAAFLGLFALFFRKILKFFNDHRRTVIIFLIVIALVGIAVVGIIMATRNRAATFDKKIVILGFDGLSPMIMEPMMQNGELPNFSTLKKKGSYRKLSTTNPSQSPVAWTGFATGQNPGKNGIFDFIVRDPGDYSLRLSLSNIVAGKPRPVVQSKSFWYYSSKKNIPTVILGCPVTFPPDKVSGKMLSGMGVPDILGTEGTFTFFTSQQQEKEKDIGGMVIHVRRSPEIITHLIGPKKARLRGDAENVKVPCRITLQEENDSVRIEFANNDFQLKPGEWSDWKPISFDVGLGREMKGILKFYLVELSPELKLYASPINFDPRDPYFPISYPRDYSNELATRFDLFHTQGLPIDTWAVNEGRLSEGPLLDQLQEVLQEEEERLNYELDDFNSGVLFSYFGTSDIVQHMFWRYIDPDHPLYEENQSYEGIIRSWYRELDRVLGRVMEKIGEEDFLIVLSDHGFDTFRRAVHVNTWLRDNGYLELQDPYAVDGAELLRDIDWSKTKAYSIGFGAIYLNQKGREKQGIVEPGQAAEDLKNEITEKLAGWIDERYDQPIVSTVYTREDIFRGDQADKTPDLYIGFNIGYRASWQTALGAVPEHKIEDNLRKWSGTHLIDPKLIPGILFSNRYIETEKPSIYDICPTVLKLIGYDEESLEKLNLDGKPLF
jgi:predicted AlkP superfamily phosphohydrolase/phosphomutase